MVTAYEKALVGDFSDPGQNESERTLWRSMAHAAGLDVAGVEPENVVSRRNLSASLTCLQEVRAACVSFRGASARAWYDLHQQCHIADSPRSALALVLSEAWLELRSGPLPGCDTRLEELERSARQNGFAELVLEAATLRAIAAAQADRQEATRFARRASRMSRTESMPQLEYLANITLAAIRRLNGEPHLAARIVSAIRRVAPALWHGWISWELLLAGVRPEGRDPVTVQLARWFDARSRGDPSRDPDLAVLGQELPAPVRHIDLVLTALEPGAMTENPWLTGAVDDVPGELCGLARLRGHAPTDETALAYVLAGHDGARRFIPMGFRDFGAVTVLPQGRRKQARTAALASTLALRRGIPLAPEVLFERIYGFAYQPEVHHSVFNVLLHRARKYVEEIGQIDRDDKGIRLRLDRPTLIPDPRCFPPDHDRVLQAIAAQAAPLSAKDASNVAGVSLRVAQIALKELVEDGFCRLEKSGRESRYVVEDTTFREPTQHR
ncbi:MAG: hypothetical protein AAFX94_02620 [Myxococcota bacterium]